MSRFVTYELSGGVPLTPGDVFEMNMDGVPYVYEGSSGVTNTYPLCASRLSELPVYDTCYDFLSATDQMDQVTRHDYPTQDYTTVTNPLSDAEYMYITPFDEIEKLDKINFGGRIYIKTGETGLATHVLSAMPMVLSG